MGGAFGLAGAEIGNVNASTVVASFSAPIVSPGNNYASGVTIRVSGTPATISSAVRQSGNLVVYYVLSAPVVSGDVVTWAYSGGDLESVTGGIPVPTTPARNVANNVAGLFSALLLENGDCLLLESGDYILLEA
jgi:hypothetical protein